MIDKIILCLFEVGFGIKINLVGEISPSELFLLASSHYYLSKLRINKNKELQRLLFLYTGLVAVQIITEAIVQNTFNNSARGIAVNIVSFLHVIFLYYYFKKQRSLIAYALIGIILRFIIFGNDLSYTDIGDSAFITFLKFRLVPLVTYSLVLIASIKANWNLSIVLCAVGIVLIVLGARSGGGIIFVAGVINYLIGIKHKLHFKNLRLTVLISCLLLYGCYCLYVQEVLSGNIKSGNSEQLFRAKNPYNPIYLLMAGRSEVFVGYIAFMDKPLTGWGAWREDPGMKYHILQSEIAGGNYNPANILTNVIPSHSVLIGSGMMNGVFALIFMFSIFVFVCKRAGYFLRANDKYTTVVLILFIDFVWHMLFSPQSAFRYVTPLAMAFILICFQTIKYNRKI